MWRISFCCRSTVLQNGKKTNADWHRNRFYKCLSKMSSVWFFNITSPDWTLLNQTCLFLLLYENYFKLPSICPWSCLDEYADTFSHAHLDNSTARTSVFRSEITIPNFFSPYDIAEKIYPQSSGLSTSRRLQSREVVAGPLKHISLSISRGINTINPYRWYLTCITVNHWG